MSSTVKLYNREVINKAVQSYLDRGGTITNLPYVVDETLGNKLFNNAFAMDGTDEALIFESQDDGLYPY